MKHILILLILSLSSFLNAQICGKFSHKRVVFDKPERISDTTVIAENIINIAATYKFSGSELVVKSSIKTHTLVVKGLKKYKFDRRFDDGFDACYVKYEYGLDDGRFIRHIQVFIKGSKIIQVQYRCAGKPYMVVYE